jgi:hypothetical protein
MIAVAQDQGKTEDVGASQSGCASPIASPAASPEGAGTGTPDAELGSYALPTPGASPEASPSPPTCWATPGTGQATAIGACSQVVIIMPDLWSQSVGRQFSGVSGASLAAISASAPYHEPAAARMTSGVRRGGVPRTQKDPRCGWHRGSPWGTSETAGGGAIVRIGFLLIVTESQLAV